MGWGFFLRFFPALKHKQIQVAICDLGIHMGESSLPTEDILPLIHTIRGQRVILAVDLAKLYGVATLRLNEAVKRNKVRFPTDFLFQLTRKEALAHSRSQIAMLNSQGANIKHLPYAFTEHGAIMAANVLNSHQAVAMSVFIVRAFVQQREGRAGNDAIHKRLAEIDKTLLVHDSALRDLYHKLLPLLEPPPGTPKPPIGFREKAPRYGLSAKKRR
jgi:hypothetical protein